MRCDDVSATAPFTPLSDARGVTCSWKRTLDERLTRLL